VDSGPIKGWEAPSPLERTARQRIFELLFDLLPVAGGVVVLIRVLVVFGAVARRGFVRSNLFSVARTGRVARSGIYLPSQLWCTYNAQDSEYASARAERVPLRNTLDIGGLLSHRTRVGARRAGFHSIRQRPDDGRVWRGYCPKRQRSGIDAEGCGYQEFRKPRKV
jgi:hypothetical protein